MLLHCRVEAVTDDVRRLEHEVAEVQQERDELQEGLAGQKELNREMQVRSKTAVAGCTTMLRTCMMRLAL